MRRKISSGLIAVIFSLIVPGILQAEPSWARKYNAACTLCHTTYPRLNRTGYEFKRLGYRLPKELENGGSSANTAQAAGLQPAHEPAVMKPTGYKPRPASSESESGRAIYQKLNCAGCHAVGDQGGRIGPPLDGIGGRRDPDFIRAHVTDPAEHARKYPELHANRPALMPHPNASPEEIVFVAAYLLTLPEPPAGFVVGAHTHEPLPEPGSVATDYTPAPETESSRAGQRLYYEQGCSGCHSIGNDGGQFGPPLDGIGARRNRQFILAHMTNAQLHAEQFPGEHSGGAAMPATDLPPAEMEQIVDFLSTLSGQNAIEVTKARIQDYFSVSYIPMIEIEREAGETETEYERRELIFYAAGPLGRYFSFFVQPLPLSEEKGFGGKFEMAQGLFNYGSARKFFQARFGQLFNIRNSGFAGADRGLTESVPFIFQTVNSFAPAGLGRGVSLEYTLPGWTTLKVFGNYNEAPELKEAEEEEEGEEHPDPQFLRSRTYGFVFEKVLGTRGLNGVQLQFVGGHTPVSIGDTREPSIRFQRYSIFANRTFVDGKNFERFNAIAGISFLRDSRFMGVESERRSRGYGYFIEVDAIPVVNHLSCFGRFDLLRPTTLVSANTVRAGTAGVIYDVVKYARVLFEYQRRAGVETANGFRIGWQLNF